MQRRDVEAHSQWRLRTYSAGYTACSPDDDRCYWDDVYVQRIQLQVRRLLHADIFYSTGYRVQCWVCTNHQCSRKRVQQFQKNVKSHVLWISKRKRKNVPFRPMVKLKCVYSLTGHLITQPLITLLPEVSTGKSRSPTSNIFLRSANTRNYATENCDKRL